MAREAVVYQLPYRQDAGPHAPVPFGAGDAIAAISSFGLDNTTLGPAFDARGLANSERVRELEFRESFYLCTQHDWKVFDFSGRMIKAGRISATQPLIGGSVPSFYVPLDQRRPHSPYRLARKIVSSFTAMLFGHGRWPQLRSEDPETQDFAEAIAKAASLETRFIRARNIGGRCGSVGVSWAFIDGAPVVRVHNGKLIHVLEWEDEDERIPAHVVELAQVPRDMMRANGKRERIMFWRRRDWTRNADVVFKETPVIGNNPAWQIDLERTCEHGDGFAHFVWIENLPDDEPGNVDGSPDYAEVYEAMNSLDVLNSVNVRGATLNLDPTLVLKMHQEDVGRASVKKGSDNALVVGPDGSASYMELAGTSIQAGIDLVSKGRMQVLETCECVVPDPDQVAAAGLSSVALRMLYAPMLGKTDLLRFQYGSQGVERVLNQMIASARRRMKDVSADAGDEYPVEITVDEEGNEIPGEPVEFFVALPPRIERVPVLDEQGQPTGDEELRELARHPGRGRLFLEWGPYFKPTSDDLVKAMTAFQTATAGKASMSQQSAVELAANQYDRDGTSEWLRVAEETRAKVDAETVGMFPPIGGEVPPGTPLPEGAPLAPTTGEGLAVKVELAPTDIAKIVTVNEARRGQGLGSLAYPDGRPDPDGFLTISEFGAKRAASVEADASIKQAAAEAQIDAAAAPPPAPPVPPPSGMIGA